MEFLERKKMAANKKKWCEINKIKEKNGGTSKISGGELIKNPRQSQRKNNLWSKVEK